MLVRTEERTGHTAAIYDLQPAPDGFYSVAADGLIVRWHRADADLGHAVANVAGGKFLSLATLADGGLVAGDLSGGVHWLYPDQPERNKHVAHHTRGVFAVLRLADAVYTAGGDGVLTRWDATTGRTVESLPVSANSLRCLATYQQTGHRALLVGASDGRAYLIPDDFTAIHPFAANEPSVFCIAPLHPTAATHFVTGGRDARLRFHELGFVKYPKLRTLDAHLATVNALAFSPDRRYLATASRDKTVKLWDARDWRLLKVCEVVRDRGHVNSVNCLLWLDDRTLLSAGDDRRILTWTLTV